MPAELLETAARIFRAEALDGYRDRKVIGGLAGFVERLGESLSDVDVTRAVNLLRDYADRIVGVDRTPHQSEVAVHGFGRRIQAALIRHHQFENSRLWRVELRHIQARNKPSV